MRRSFRVALSIAAVVAVLGSVSILIRRSESPQPWNVLLLVPDTVRADHVSINGYWRETTPFFDQLAREGTNFTEAITVAPRTWQSYSSIITGLYPPRHGVRCIYDNPLIPDLPTLATLLKQQGYATATFDGNAFLEQMTGCVGFDDCRRADTTRAQETQRHEEEVLIDQIIEWIESNEEPFFAFVRLSGGHWPYVENPWTQTFESCEGQDHGFNEGSQGLLFGELGRGLILGDADAHRQTFFPPPLPERTLRHMIAHYDAKLRFGDALIGRLVDHLRKSGQLEKTIVAVTSDHGESFGEHGYRQHGPRVDEPVMRVPLVIRLPKGHTAYNPGGNNGQLVRLVDILPTVLDVLRLPIPAEIDGVSLLPAIKGESLPNLWAYGESGRDYVGLDPERFFPGVKGKQRMIRTSDWKLVRVARPEGPEYRLFDLKHDAAETRNVAAKHPDRVAELANFLDPFLRLDEVADEERELTEEEREHLRKLGYSP
jgi:arylsulfatase A-like enzyme